MAKCRVSFISFYEDIFAGISRFSARQNHSFSQYNALSNFISLLLLLSNGRKFQFTRKTTYFLLIDGELLKCFCW